eukprot:jgi/Mesvir1/7765/Mv11708-RA.1
MTSVRIYAGSETAPTEVNVTDDFDAADVEEPDAHRARAKHARTNGPPSVLRPGVHLTGKGLSRTSDEYKALIELIPGVVLTNAFRDGDGSASVYWVWSHNKECANKGGEHENNNVWYEINCNGVFQRCFDENCRGFRSSPTPIPLSIMRRLFGSRTLVASSTARKMDSPMSAAAERLMYKTVYNPKRARTGRKAKARRPTRDE